MSHKKMSLKLAMNMAKNDRKFNKRMKDLEGALGLTMNRVCQVSDITSQYKSNEMVDKMLEDAEISSLIPCASNAEIEEIVDDPSKKEAVVKYVIKITPRNNQYHLNVHRSLLKFPMLGRTYLSQGE